MEEIRPIDKKVLIVEDEPDLREALETAMSVAGGFTVLTASDGEQAVTLATAEKPDMIFLDIRIPKLDGSQVLKQVRACGEWGQHVPVSILTAQSDLAVVSQALEVGGTHTNYLTKTDWSLEKLVNHANEQLHIKK